jgi:hypothetical protein
VCTRRFGGDEEIFFQQNGERKAAGGVPRFLFPAPGRKMGTTGRAEETRRKRGAEFEGKRGNETASRRNALETGRPQAMETGSSCVAARFGSSRSRKRPAFGEPRPVDRHRPAHRPDEVGWCNVCRLVCRPWIAGGACSAGRRSILWAAGVAGGLGWAACGALGEAAANVSVTLEITAEFEHGVPDHIKRAASENAGSLGFKAKEWE